MAKDILYMFSKRTVARKDILNNNNAARTCQYWLLKQELRVLEGKSMEPTSSISRTDCVWDVDSSVPCAVSSAIIFASRSCDINCFFCRFCVLSSTFHHLQACCSTIHSMIFHQHTVTPSAWPERVRLANQLSKPRTFLAVALPATPALELGRWCACRMHDKGRDRYDGVGESKDAHKHNCGLR